jgi:hypothetical protein
VERASHPGRAPAGRHRFTREAVVGHRGKDQVKGILGAPAIRGRVCQRFDDLRSSMIEPGQPCVMSSGIASPRGERVCAN